MAVKVLLVLGTRPEAIKLAPVYFALKERGADVRIVSTGQQEGLTNQAIREFGIFADFGLEPNSYSLDEMLCDFIRQLEPLIRQFDTDWVLVQGDTTSALAGAISAYYKQVKIGHVEAGLRTGDLYAPFPEEGNRRMIDQIATLKFAPTKQAADNVSGSVVVGNTVIDAMNRMPVKAGPSDYVLVTAHRRESWGEPLERICQAVSEIAEYRPVIFQVHPNPNVSETIKASINGSKNIKLVEPKGYANWVNLMRNASVILTDSGGIQEEAPSLGVPVVVMRDKTERPEAVEGGFARLAGTTVEGIWQALDGLDEWRAEIAGKPNPFGDGHAAERIADLVVGHG